MTRRPAKLRADHRWRRPAASGCFRHTITGPWIAFESAEIPFLQKPALLTVRLLTFIFRVVPSKCAGLIGKGLNFHPLLAVVNKLGPILTSDF